MLTSASTYCRPFWMMEMRAAGGTRAPLMLDWLMWLSMPKVNAEWENPGGGMDNLESKMESMFNRRGRSSGVYLIWNIFLNIGKQAQSTAKTYLTLAGICKPGNWLHHCLCSFLVLVIKPLGQHRIGACKNKSQSRESWLIKSLWYYTP